MKEIFVNPEIEIIEVEDIPTMNVSDPSGIMKLPTDEEWYTK